jgi:geranyl-CoA carboxylase alpha subunit
MQSALHDLVALGVKTNQSFLRRSLAHPVFAAGQANTAFIAQNEAVLLHENTAPQALAVAAWLLHQNAAVPAQRKAARLAHALPVGLQLSVNGQSLKATVTQTGPDQFTVHVAEQTHALVSVAQTEHSARVIVDQVMQQVQWVHDGHSLNLHFAGHPLQVIDLTRAVGAKPGQQGGDGKVRASMNGRVVAVLVAVGERVQAQQALVTLEAMKMEHVHAAPVAGRVIALHAATGEQVPASRVLVEIQADEAPAFAERKNNE